MHAGELNITASEGELERQLAELKEKYADSLEEKIETIVADWNSCAAGVAGPDVFEGLVRSVHSLVGSGAMYGFPEISAAARELGKSLVGIGGPNTAHNSVAHEIVQSLLDRLVDVIHGIAGGAAHGN